MNDELKGSIVPQRSPAVDSTMIYYQGRDRQTSDRRVISRDNSFSSTELSVSRNSSFSSCSSGSATGSSGYGCALDTDSSLSRSSKSTGLDVRFDSSPKSIMTKPDDLSCSRRLITSRVKHRLERKSLDMRDLGNSLSNRYHSHPSKKTAEGERGSTRPFSLPERSNSETEIFLHRSHLSSPKGLIISTPPAKGSHLSGSEKRARSKSESHDEKSSPSIDQGERAERPKESRKSKGTEQSKRRETTAVDWCLDESAMKRCLVLLEASCEGRKGHKIKDATKRIAALENEVELVSQERDVALRERNEIMHDRDRIKCERDALELERDKLLRDKERLEKELINRSNVIDHLKEHLGLAVIPVNQTARTLNCPVVTVSKKITCEKGTPAGSKFKTRPRSKSEIRTPDFYFPDQILKTNAYTCL